MAAGCPRTTSMLKRERGAMEQPPPQQQQQRKEGEEPGSNSSALPAEEAARPAAGDTPGGDGSSAGESCGAAVGVSADDPFSRFNIASHEPLRGIERRPCPQCNKKRKYFCYDCLRPMTDPSTVPHVKLPCELHVIKHPQESASKSTGVHAPVLSDARLISYDRAEGE